MNILFMGTPDFATASLAALLDAGKHVCAVVTQPDKARGRGMKVTFSDVKKFALEKNLPVLQPETLKNGAFLPTLEEYKPDLIAVVAYGKILPEYILNFPKYGCVNVHGSLLPKYRGAAPIQRAVLNGDSISGVTTMRLDKGMDTGDMYLSEAVEIGENMTTGELFDALAEIGGKLLVQTVDALENGSAKPLPQDHANATHADKITPEECEVDFSLPARAVHNRIRGLSPFPGAFSHLDGKIVKLYDSRLNDETGEKAPCGTVLEASRDGVVIACGTGSVRLLSFKPEGKGILSAADMVNGRKIAAGMRFETGKDAQ